MQRIRRLAALTSLVAIVIMLSVFIIGRGAPMVRAQEEAEESHPAHIHSGTCAQLGDVVAPLSNIGGEALVDGTPMAGQQMGPASAIPVEVSITTVPMALADIISGGHAINIHESAENIGNYIACGDIGGTMIGTSDLAIGLGELNSSGYSGVAWLHDNGNGTTTVYVFLTEEYGPAGEATPEAAAAGTTAVTIQGFAFNPPTIEVAAGTTVTWTNMDSAPHTVTSTGNFQSGRLDQGATFQHTFDTPGTYDYFCEFHANMKGQVIVK
jgi:plastocyanin